MVHKDDVRFGNNLNLLIWKFDFGIFSLADVFDHVLLTDSVEFI